MMGYAEPSQRARGVHMDLWARAYYLRAGDVALAFVNVTQATDGAKVSVSGFGSGAPSYVTHATVELTTSLNAGGTASYVNIFNNVSAPYNAGLANMVLICDAGRSVTIEREIARRIFLRLRSGGTMVRTVIIAGANREPDGLEKASSQSTSHGGFDNDVARILGNVLRRFSR